jgi:hypothetical protein
MTKTNKGLIRAFTVLMALVLVIGLTTVICFAADDSKSNDGILSVGCPWMKT